MPDETPTPTADVTLPGWEVAYLQWLLDTASDETANPERRHSARDQVCSFLAAALDKGRQR